ncbi:hypothetical protein DCS_01569 [Drechmeria coniospora]|uniref:OTU domain-containing protein n=1 Tax=Drechmeria coniospora TaxID=98403 RepID=A0A151GTU5_DRECN|nr:hypothetical protein DCS_01569 [Drechmeria coniospora]KYK60432.1 hypothetical protein DCS_01569 [Drechmeria coniospora]
MEGETLDHLQARHRKELKELQGRITSKKKNATKKTRKGVNDECAEMERRLREKQAAEIAAEVGETTEGAEDPLADEADAERGTQRAEDETAERRTEKLSLRDGNGAADANRNLDAGAPSPRQPPVKRNRQKERLARRAAEQEAAAERAEQEASSMTDHRAREGEFMKSTFAAYSLVEEEVAPDGHCLFAAVADQLGRNDIPLLDGPASLSAGEPAYRLVRRAAAAYMEEHADDFAPFLDEDLAAYVAKMRDTAEWGGQLELTALARRYGAEIRVVQDGRLETIGDEGAPPPRKTLWLAYYRHGYGLGEHYNSLRPTAATTAGKTPEKTVGKTVGETVGKTVVG